jgi:two-component system OmpR family response regulator
MAKFDSVLIVDDSERCIEFMSRAFEAEGGIHVSSEMSPLRALARICDERPSLVLLDIKMPGLDGFGLLAQLREEGNALPVIMLSESARQQDINRAYALGCNGYFQKPSSIADYRALVSAVVGYWRRGELSAASGSRVPAARVGSLQGTVVGDEKSSARG